jgi:hypothetical protein
MQSSSLSQVQGCLRLQSVYRAHRTRRCVLQRSRLDFERILGELEPEPSRPRIVFPHAFICRPHIERHSTSAATVVQACVTQNYTAPLSSSSSTASTAATLFSRSSALQVPVAHSDIHAASTSSPASSAPASPSIFPPSHDATASVTTIHVRPAATTSESVGVGTSEDDSTWTPFQLPSQNQHQRMQEPSSSFCDAAVQSVPLFLTSTTADACVGHDRRPSSASFQELCDSSSISSACCHDHLFEDVDRPVKSRSSSPSSRGSCEASRSSIGIPPSPFFAERLQITEHRLPPSPLPASCTHLFTPHICSDHASPLTFGMRHDQQSSPPSSSQRSSGSGHEGENSATCRRVSISADTRFLLARLLQQAFLIISQLRFKLLSFPSVVASIISPAAAISSFS